MPAMGMTNGDKIAEWLSVIELGGCLCCISATQIAWLKGSRNSNRKVKDFLPGINLLHGPPSLTETRR